VSFGAEAGDPGAAPGVDPEEGLGAEEAWVDAEVAGLDDESGGVEAAFWLPAGATLAGPVGIEDTRLDREVDVTG
jgi:hypothetical protein